MGGSSWRATVQVARRFLPELSPHRGRIALVIALSVAVTAIELLKPWPLKWIIDHALMPRGGETLEPLQIVGAGTLIALVLAVGGAAAQYLREIQLASVGHQVTRGLRLMLFRHLAFLSPRFHARHKSGDLLVRLMGDAPMLQGMLVESAIELATRTTLVLGTVTIMVALDPVLALVVLAAVPLVLLTVRTAASRIRTAVRKQRGKEGVMADFLHEAVAGVALIQSLGRSEETVRRFARSNRKSTKAGLKATRLSAGLSLRVESTLGVALAAALGVGAWRVLEGHLTAGELLVFMSYLRGTLKPIRSASKHSDRVARGTACGERILEVLDSHVDVTSAPGAPPAPDQPVELRFREVSFAYEPGQPALDGFDAAFRRGELTGLLGRSGAGKSTVAALALRLHDPQAGSVELDGVDIRTFEVRSLRDRFGLCLQDTILFGETIRENLLLGRPDAGDDELRAALRAAAAEDFVDGLPGGIDARLGSQGTGLSGGQRRRLSLARTLLRKAPVLIVDEPFAGLDRATAERVRVALAALADHRIVIVIVHENEYTDFFDRVVRLEDGRVSAIAAAAHDAPQAAS